MAVRRIWRGESLRRCRGRLVPILAERFWRRFVSDAGVESEETYAMPVRRSSSADSARYIVDAIFARSLHGCRQQCDRSIERRTIHLTGSVSISNPPSRLSTYVAAAFPNCRRVTLHQLSSPNLALETIVDGECPTDHSGKRSKHG